MKKLTGIADADAVNRAVLNIDEIALYDFASPKPLLTTLDFELFRRKKRKDLTILHEVVGKTKSDELVKN